MKPALPLLVMTCAGLSAWTWLALPEAARVPAASKLETAPLPEPALEPVFDAALRVALPGDEARVVTLGPVHSVPLVDERAEFASMSPAEVERLARDYFHALVAVEELDRALPPEQDPPQRTQENLPGFFAAIAERDRLGERLALAPRRKADEPLPYLVPVRRSEEALPSPAAHTPAADYERAYRGFTREDFYLEHWLLTRAVHTESARVLDDRLTNGPYQSRPIEQAATFG